MKVIEYASGEPQACGAHPALCSATTRDTVRPAILISTIPVALISRGLRRAWHAFGARSAWTERVPIPSMGDRQSTSACRTVKAENWIHASPAVDLKVFALSLVCAVIGPAVAAIIFVLMNNN